MNSPPLAAFVAGVPVEGVVVPEEPVKALDALREEAQPLIAHALEVAKAVRASREVLVKRTFESRDPFEQDVLALACPVQGAYVSDEGRDACIADSLRYDLLRIIEKRGLTGLSPRRLAEELTGPWDDPHGIIKRLSS